VSAYLARTQPALQHQQEHGAIPPSMNPLHEHRNFVVGERLGSSSGVFTRIALRTGRWRLA
jgi:hypothetical protein